MAHIRQCRPDSGLGFQVKVFKIFEVVPSSLGSGRKSVLGGMHAFKERCPPRQRSRVERLKANVESLLTKVTVENE